MNQNWHRRGVYAITADVADTASLLATSERVLEGGVGLLQYRNKQASDALRHEQVAELLVLCRAFEVPLIVNDDWRLAAAVGADGAHLGGDDGDIALARQGMGADAIIGASCYDELARARAAAAAGASYVAFGAFFPSVTKPQARICPREVLEASAGFGMPRVAIGGITPDNAGALVDAGADMVAVISGIFDALDPAAAVRAYARHFSRSGDARSKELATE